MLGDTMGRFNKILPRFLSDSAWTWGGLKKEIDLGVRMLPFHIVQKIGKRRTEGTQLLFGPISIDEIAERGVLPYVVGGTKDENHIWLFIRRMNEFGA